MMNFTDFTDEQIAALLFALERYCDNMNEYGFSEIFESEANKLYSNVANAYKRRNLDWKQFQKEKK